MNYEAGIMNKKEKNGIKLFTDSNVWRSRPHESQNPLLMILDSRFKSNPNPAGFSALLMVLVMGVAVLSMAYGASLLGLGALDLGYTARRGGEALSAADGCLEEAMRRLRLDAGYAGGSLPVGNNSCTINVTVVGGGQQRQLMVLGQSGSYYKKIQAIVTVALEPIGSLNTITVDSWEERSD